MTTSCTQILYLRLVNRAQLHQLIHECVKQSLAEQNADFGKELFGQELGRPKKDPELNTPEENKLKRDVESHYQGEMEELAPWIPQLVQLHDAGKYKNVLQVPAKYKYAYRVMSSIQLNELAQMLPNGEESDKLYETSFEPGKLYSYDGANYMESAKTHSSWTVDFEAIKKIYDDWGGFGGGNGTFIVFLRAPIKSNKFILNPDVTAFMSKHFDYQREILSVGDVKCDKMWYALNEGSHYGETTRNQKRHVDSVVAANKPRKKTTQQP